MPLPTVTVLMPVHNGAAYLRPAIGSILRQSFTDFEFIIVDDDSSDDSSAIAQSFRDPRIRLLRAPERLRICKALNLGLDHATGQFVARMDADDISHPCRLERQVAYMMRHPDVAVCGTWIRRFGDDGATCVDKRPAADNDIRAFALFDNPLVHSTVMIRRHTLEAFALRYEEAYRNAEDYELWTRLFRHGCAANLPRVLLDYRVHAQSVTTTAGGGMDEAASGVVKHLLAGLGIHPTDDEVRFHRSLGAGRLYPGRTRDAIRRAESWLNGLLQANDRQQVYSPRALRRAVAEVWYRTCYHSLSEGTWIVNRYLVFWRSACRGACPGRVATFLGAAAKARLRQGSAS